MKKELKRFKKLLSPDYPECSASEEEEQEQEEDGQNQVKEGTLKIALHVLRKMNQTEFANKLQISKSSGHVTITSLHRKNSSEK